MTYKPLQDAYKDATILLADLDATLLGAAAGTMSLRTLGTGATQALPGNTAVELLANKGAPSGYAALDGSTLLSTAVHGSGTANATTFLRGDRTWGVPSASIVYVFQTKTTTYTILATDDVVWADAAGGAFTLTLHAASTAVKPITIKRVNSGANNVTIDGNASETIDGALTYAITQVNESITLAPISSTAWGII